MLDRFTEKAKRVMFFARYEIANYGVSQIESEHLLLGLLRESRSIVDAPRAAANAPEIIRRRIHQQAARQEKATTSLDPPTSPEVQRIFDHAAEEASAFGHLSIGTDHLLAGILREETCLAATLLREQGLKLELLREELRNAPPVTPAHARPQHKSSPTPQKAVKPSSSPVKRQSSSAAATSAPSTSSSASSVRTSSQPSSSHSAVFQ